MTDLIEKYKKLGLISDPARNFRMCDRCGEEFHPDDLTVVCFYFQGGESLAELCGDCYVDAEKDPSPYCSDCGATKKDHCHCGPIPENE